MLDEETLRVLIAEYRHAGVCHDLDSYRAASDLVEAIDRAGLARMRGGSRHRHQARIPELVLEEFTARLQQNRVQLEDAVDFDAIYSIVKSRKVPGIGELAIYDTALRIGAFRGQLPKRVYLHSGARTGAVRLGIPGSRRAPSLSLSAFQQVLVQQLEPYQIEDFLCQFKDQF